MSAFAHRTETPGDREKGTALKRESDMRVSAVVPVHNSAAYIEETLHSLINQKRRFDEIIVVDDGSTDGTVELAGKYPVRILSVPRCGRSAARNIGLREAGGDIIAFIESDAVYESDWLSEVMQEFEKGSRAVIDRRRMYRPTTYYARLSDHLYDLRYAEYVPFNAWAMEKSLAEGVGGFDEGLYIAEDVDLGDRIKASGASISLAEKAVHYHKGEASTFRCALRRSYLFGRGIPLYWLKDPRKRSLPRLARTLALFWGIFCPPVFLYAFVKTLGKRYLWAIRKGMRVDYLPIEPFLYTATQLFFQAGAAVTLAKGLFIKEKFRISWKGPIPSIEPRRQ